MSSMIDVQALTKRYGDAQVLRGVDLQVDAGEIFALLGPNGAGKTTTVRILATLATPDGGAARVAGADVVAERHQVRRRIALSGQYAALDELQTGRENLRMMSRLAGLRAPAARRRAEELLATFALQEAADRRVGTYSGGMRRRLDLAASLVAHPSVIFLDEPTTGLDPRSRQDMWTVVAGLARAGTTVFLTTQYLEEADRLADRIAVLDDGRVVAQGSAGQLKARVGDHRLELIARDAHAHATLRDRLGRRVVEERPQARLLTVPVAEDAAAVRALLAEADPDAALVARFTTRSTSLDDVFLTLTGRPAAVDTTNAATATTATTTKETADV